MQKHSSKTGRRTRSKRRGLLRLKIATVLLLATGLVIGAWHHVDGLHSKPPATTASTNTHQEQAQTNAPSPMLGMNASATPELLAATASPLAKIVYKNGRPVYPYSVIPGGVYTVEELRDVMAKDAVVAEHYKDFDFESARVIDVTETFFAHVSYRIDEQIFWTKKKLAIREGEKLITDGRVVIRARCGNRIADNEQPNISPLEPEEDYFDTPITEPSLLSGLEGTEAFAAAPFVADEDFLLAELADQHFIDAAAPHRLPDYFISDLPSTPYPRLTQTPIISTPQKSAISPSPPPPISPLPPQPPTSPEKHDAVVIPTPSTLVLVILGIAGLVIPRVFPLVVSIVVFARSVFERTCRKI